MNKEVIWIDGIPKVTEILLDEEIEEQDFVHIINDIYKQDCFIYAIIPDWEEDLLYQLSDNFILINKVKFPLIRIFPRTIGLVGYVEDHKKQYIYEFYSRSTSMDFLIFSEVDVSQYINNITKKNMDIYKIFEVNKVPHIRIGPDGQWLNLIEY